MFGLMPHPSNRTVAVNAITVVARRTLAGIDLRYRLIGALDRIVFPAQEKPERSDDLWQGTCFELFARERDRDAYQEFNFSPSFRWAAYAFEGYRTARRDAEIFFHQIATRRDGTLFELHANIVAEEMDDDAPWQIGLSAIVEEIDGARSYWALAHPPGEPDFHDPDCFAGELVPMG